MAQGALVRGLVVDEVVSTNDLEGVHSTRRQINELIQSDEEGRDPFEQRRFRELARLYLDLYGEIPQKPTNPEDIRRIYDRVMDGEPLDERHVPDGRLFRKDGVEIYSPGGKVLHRGVEPEASIHEMMARMLALTNSEEIPEVYSAIMGHLIFEYTHPFYDGNGRCGRYLLALHLSSPLSILTTLSLSRVLAENRGTYYKSFRDVEHPMNHGELTSFVINILECIRTAQEELDFELGRKRDAYEALQSRLGEYVVEEGLGKRESDIVGALALLQLFAAFPATSLADLSRYIDLSQQQTRMYTKRLEANNIIMATSRRPLRFVLTDMASGKLGIMEP